MMNQEAKAIELIRKNTNYSDSYFQMMDAGLEYPDLYWYRHKDQCGEDVSEESNN